MERSHTLLRILVVIGTVLVWIPILAPGVFGFVSLNMDGIYRFDYLMPVELGMLAFIGGVLLLWAAIRTKSRLRTVAWGIGIAAGAIAILYAIGDVEPGSLRWGIAIGMLTAYSLALVVLGVGGILLWRDLFKKG